MAYDIAAKVLIERCRGEILRRFLGLPVTESTVLEDVPQETASLRRSDFPILVTEVSGQQRLVLIEVQSRWESDFPLRLLEYRCRHKLRQSVEVISCALLLTPSTMAIDHYEDNEVSYRYRLIPVYELDAEEIIEEGVVCLLPLVPLMRRGVELTLTADEMIYESDMPQGTKADMLTTMAVMSGLVSTELPSLLVARRRDVMIESVTYEILKKEWTAEAQRQAREEGREEGRQEGRQEGQRDGLLDAIAFGLDLRFGPRGLRLMPEINDIQNIGVLRAIRERLKVVQMPEELREVYR